MDRRHIVYEFLKKFIALLVLCTEISYAALTMQYTIMNPMYAGNRTMAHFLSISTVSTIPDFLCTLLAKIKIYLIKRKVNIIRSLTI